MTTTALVVDPRFTPFQKDFFTQFTSGFGPGRVFVLRAPVGCGAASTIVGTLAELYRTGRASRILVLTRPLLARQWAQRVEDKNQTATVLDARAFRLLMQDAKDPTGWPEGWYLASIDLAKRADVSRALLGQHWDVVVTDEAHCVSGQRRRLLEDLHAKVPSAAFLLTSGVPLPHMQLLVDAQVFDWTTAVEELLAVQRERVEIERKTLMYRRSPQEVALLMALQDVASKAIKPAGFSLLRRAASSYLALERTLEVHASGTSVLAVDAERLLDQLDGLGSDAKLERFLDVVEELNPGSHFPVVVFTDYTDTMHYLTESLRDQGKTCLELHSGIDVAERASVVRRHSEQGGVLVATVAALQGLELAFARAVIHYDLPASPAAILVRDSRILRFGRTTPCMVYSFEDESSVLPLERALLQLSVKVEQAGTDVDVDLNSLLEQRRS